MGRRKKRPGPQSDKKLQEGWTSLHVVNRERLGSTSAKRGAPAISALLRY